MKTAIIAIAKCEELYIKEWLDYHLNLGFDAIIVADNDDELILSGYSSDRVIIEDYTKVECVQPKAYTELYHKYQKDYDWILFLDIDEFVVLEEDKTINDFLSRFSRDEVDTVRLTGKHFTDNDELDVIDGNYNVFDRFTTPIDTEKDNFCKSFINTRIDTGNARILGHGLYTPTLRAVDAKGEKCTTEKRMERVVHEVAWYNHYRTKTIGEYIRQKYKRGGANKNDSRYGYFWERYFKVTNNLTEEKIEYAVSLGAARYKPFKVNNKKINK